MSQQKRIEELDAQLNEAEGVIVDLRAEIRKAHERLEEVKNSRMLQSNGPSENKYLHHENASQSHDKQYDVTELYRNGYTHRIRATERNLVPQEEIVDVDETNSGKCAPTSIVTENTDTKNINGPEVVSVNHGVANDQTVKRQRLPRSNGVAKGQTVKSLRLPRRSVRYAQSNHKLSRFYHGSSIKRATEPEKLKCTENNENGDSTLRRSVRKRKVRCWEDISSLFKSRAALSRCKKYSAGASKDDELPDDSKLVNVSVAEEHEIDEKESNGVACDTDKNKLLKYTFSRRSKKALSSKSDNYAENEKPDLIEYPSSDSQNMVDVACQVCFLFTKFISYCN